MRATPLLRLCTDDTLVRRATGGDDDAFATLYDRYRLRLEAYCRGILRHDEDARDAAQNALAAAYQALRRGTHPVAFRPWLFRIAHNEAISIIRRRRVADELPETLPAAVSGPADALELREELTAVLDAVRALAPGARSALLLRELGGLEYPEVAQVLGTTPGGARQAVFEARVALQDDRVGRGTACEVIRHELSVHDGRRRQSRQIRGHLRGCGSCRDWSRAQRQRRQRLALGSLPFPFAGWIAGAIGGLASAGSGATLSSGLAVNAQTLAALAVVVVGAPTVVVDRDRATSGDDTPAAAAPQTPAGGSGDNVLASSAGPARLTTTTGTPPRDPSGAVLRAVSATSGDAGDGGDAERRRPGAVEQTGTRGPEGDRPAGSRYTAEDDRQADSDWWSRPRQRGDGRRRGGGGDDHDDGPTHETATPVAAHPARRPGRERQPAPVPDAQPAAPAPQEPAPAAPVDPAAPAEPDREAPAADEPVAEPTTTEPIAPEATETPAGGA
ncbi:sigma-70 family RNA polymerase sigma factor [Svornostia abyssi]|uniref:Sigma-70 family RNA polymerase sigma factor n=1 Tax=Svornostia abyssi TaxID=2898438 RepID=A0ABY5PDV5_9ACTN|nr:sigma-70 family RNA polymerase sigma factor [Parviterribacteraceae bacterium J379]